MLALLRCVCVCGMGEGGGGVGLERDFCDGPLKKGQCCRLGKGGGWNMALEDGDSFDPPPMTHDQHAVGALWVIMLAYTGHPPPPTPRPPLTRICLGSLRGSPCGGGGGGLGNAPGRSIKAAP